LFIISISADKCLEVPVNSGVSREGDFSAKSVEFFVKVMEIFQKLMEF
jgi:hypothetical protein